MSTYSVRQLIAALEQIQDQFEQGVEIPVFVPDNNATLSPVNIGANLSKVHFVGEGPDSGAWDEVREGTKVKTGKIVAVIIE